MIPTHSSKNCCSFGVFGNFRFLPPPFIIYELMIISLLFIFHFLKQGSSTTFSMYIPFLKIEIIIIKYYMRYDIYIYILTQFQIKSLEIF